MMLFARYGFSSLVGNGSSMNSTNYLVPAMLDILDGTVSKLLPNDADRYTLFIKFEGPMPNWLFERVVCEFVSCQRVDISKGTYLQECLEIAQTFRSAIAGYI